MQRHAVVFFSAAVFIQLALGAWRSRMLMSSTLPALALAALVALVGVLWVVRQRQMAAAPLGGFVSLLFATIGALSAVSALNAPLIGTVARISIPLFAFSAAAVLMTATAERRFQRIAFGVFIAAFLLLQIDLTRDALWESGRSSLVDRR